MLFSFLFLWYLNLNRTRTQKIIKDIEKVETTQESPSYDNPVDYSEKKVEDINENTLKRQQEYTEILQ